MMSPRYLAALAGLTAMALDPRTSEGGGRAGSKPRRDSTQEIRAKKRWLKKRKRNSRRGVYTTRGVA